MKLRSTCLLSAALFAFSLSGASCAFAKTEVSPDGDTDRLIIGFKQVVCKAACPFDLRSANCTTQTFRIGDCVPTSENGWYALVVDCAGPDMPPIPPRPTPSVWPKLSNNNNKDRPQNDREAVIHVAEGGRGRGSGQLFALDSPPPQKTTHHDESAEDSIVIMRKRRRRVSHGARPPIPPHITIRYVHNANTTFNKSTTCKNSNETKLSKEAVGRCFALNTDDSEEDEGADRSDGSFSRKGQKNGHRNSASSLSLADGFLLGGRRATEDEGSDLVPFYSKRLKQLSSLGRSDEIIGDGDDVNDLTFDAKDEAFERDAKEKFLLSQKAGRGIGDSYSSPPETSARFFAVNYCYSIKVKK